MSLLITKTHSFFFFFSALRLCLPARRHEARFYVGVGDIKMGLQQSASWEVSTAPH
jgi:hypothetical protein